LHAVGRLSDLALPAPPSRTAVAALHARLVRWRQRHCGCIVLFHDAAYPPLLREIAQPPVALFVEGQVDALHGAAVALVGSRAAASEYVRWTRDTATDLARAGLIVASGMARGIDAAAHRGALDIGAPTYAVLGTGTDVVYPPENAELQRDIVQRGCVVSELPPGTQALAWHFPSRNRILAGLSRGVVVVQAEKRSGALITARHALSENREVMAVPGCVVDPRSRGTHELLRQGAALVEAAPDVLNALHWKPEEGAAKATPAALLLAQLSRPRDLDSLRHRLHWDAATLQRVLAELELAGWIVHDRNGDVRRLPDGPG
jgi:DNA processing protein